MEYYAGKTKSRGYLIYNCKIVSYEPNVDINFPLFKTKWVTPDPILEVRASTFERKTGIKMKEGQIKNITNLYLELWKKK